MSANMLKSAMFFSLKASQEVKRFLDSGKYSNISKEIDGVLYYFGRVLPDYKFHGYPDRVSIFFQNDFFLIFQHSS